MQPVKLNFQSGLYVDDVQIHRLGIPGIDEHNRLWSYVQFMENVVAGEVVCDQASADLLSSSPGTVASALSVAGTRFIDDTGEFAGDDFVGARGAIVGGTVAQGAAQGFWITKMVSDDRIQVSWYYGPADPRTANDASATLLTNATSTYELWFPGRVRDVQAASPQDDVIRGVAQIDVTGVAATTPKFGWVLQKGFGWALLDVSDVNTIAYGQDVKAIANGLVAGAGATGRIIGIAKQNDLTGVSTDSLISVDFNINNTDVSYRFPRTANPYNTNTLS